MALRCWDGFDHYNTAADMGQRQGFLQWNYLGGVSFVTGSLGYGKAMQIFYGQAACTFSSALTTFYAGLRITPSAGGSAVTVNIYVMDQIAGQPQYTVSLNCSSGQVSVYRGGGTGGTLLGQSGLNAFAPSTSGYWEFGGVMSGTVGTVTVRLNGQAISGLTLTGLNNVSTANVSMSGLQLFGPNNNNADYDDFYLCDGTTGPGTYPCNTFLGDVRVDTLFAAGQGTVTWTPLTGTNWGEVSEVAMDSDTSYNYTSTVGNTDTLTFGALAGTISAVLGVQVTGAYRKDDAGSHTVVQGVVSSGTAATGGTYSVGSTYSYLTDLFVLDPSTSLSWTSTAIGSIRATYELAS